MRLARFAACLLVLLLAAAPAAGQARLFSKTYQFKTDVKLEVGQATEDGIRLDSVLFRVPGSRSGGPIKAEVAVSNTSSGRGKVGVAIALFDEQGRLVGVASAGTHLLPLRADRQRTFKLLFDHVTGAAREASTFQVTIESLP